MSMCVYVCGGAGCVCVSVCVGVCFQKKIFYESIKISELRCSQEVLLFSLCQVNYNASYSSGMMSFKTIKKLECCKKFKVCLD